MVDNNNKNVGQIRLNGETQCTINITVLVAIKYWLQAIKNVPNVARIISVAHMAFGYFAYSVVWLLPFYLRVFKCICNSTILKRQPNSTSLKYSSKMVKIKLFYNSQIQPYEQAGNV